MNEAPLFRFNSDRDFLVSEVSRRVWTDYLTRSRERESNALEYVLNETAYVEMERLRHEQGPEDEIHSRPWWKSMSRRLTDMSEDEKREVLKRLVEAYTEDTAGKFDPAVFKFASGMLPLGLSFLFKAQDLRHLPSRRSELREALTHLRDLQDRIVIDGHLSTLRSLAKKGTLVVVPTHSSNMDSILMGWSLEESGLPPVTYGAGKNLFTNPLTSFFMHNLGAYKVDRRITHQVYKDVLKSYSQVLLEQGYHSLFFPGGTRCRSNIVESKLKLGLLGTAVNAYVENLRAGNDRRIYVCPVTLNYNLVLEAESLIREYLRREGGGRYFLENDEFNQLSTIIRFVLNTVRMDATTVLRFGKPMDVFGNRVEADGESYDARGRRLDPADFVRSIRTNEVVKDVARDREYTRHTGECIAEAFRRNTVLLSTSVVAFALFELVQNRFPRMDVYQLLRLNFEETIPWHEIRQTVAEFVNELRELADRDRLQLGPRVLDHSVDEIVEEGIDTLTMYHIPQTIEYVPSGVRINRLDVLFFYGNRVRTFDDIEPQALIERARI